MFILFYQLKSRMSIFVKYRQFVSFLGGLGCAYFRYLICANADLLLCVLVFLCKPANMQANLLDD